MTRRLVHHGLNHVMGLWALVAPKTPPLRSLLPPRSSRRRATHTAMATTTRRRPRRDSKGPNSDLSRTLTDCTRRGDAAAAMAAFDNAVSDPDYPTRLAAHQYNQLLHLLATADRSSIPSPAAAARRVFSHMLQAGAPPSEATITSLARVTAAPDADNPASAADEAFELVATMKDKHGLAPRLRSYSPVLAAFRRAGDASKAYAVEAHMAASGVSPEEPELASLLDVSSTAGDADKVYEYMHKLRQTVECVSEETAQVVEGWFKSDKAAMAGKPEWDATQVKDAIVLNGGGCHRLGWLGTGPWTVQRVRAGPDAQCGGCRCQLACVDIDMEETQRFADSVAGLALERETKTNFSQFQVHLLFPIAVILASSFAGSAAKCSFAKSLRINFRKLTRDNASCHLYWLYAAIKLNCLLVTNDEMRDHIFELLGSSFFPKWKQRHRVSSVSILHFLKVVAMLQVKYTFNKGKAVLVMPPPYSSEIQESEMGSWHIPMEEKSGDERVRIWLCIGRIGSCKEPDEVPVNGVVQEVPPTEASSGVQQGLPEDKVESITGKRKDRD
ncbi:Proteinaceous RNase P 1, chloroplastic/mitochondrial [Dichanthelium oligosanthes]|uniref:ribonuclease P n=1 Tax=Dichanthelium oligosanthes TaxID=888268 RepID=A0A1E5UPM8_9POAL|nr:Proteinaceous RNase P 1, chloroplastic/mitochondrial [Dichanthelium oligosanthes]